MVARNMKHGLMTRRPADRAQPARDAHRIRWDVTHPQLTAIAALTSLTLVSSIVLPDRKVNPSLSAAGPPFGRRHSDSAT
jgi:hypothetical protein